MFECFIPPTPIVIVEVQKTEANMNEDPKFNIMYFSDSENVKNLSELKKFASFFHQDIYYQYDNFKLASDCYISSLSQEDLHVLRQELTEFIQKHRKSSSRKLRLAWYDMGAHAGLKGENLLKLLSYVERQIGKDSLE